MRKWFNAQEQKWQCKDFPFSLFSSLANHLEDEFSLASTWEIFHSQFLVSFCSLKIFFVLSFTLWEQKLEVFGENLPLFCYLCAAAVAATQLHTTILWASTILVERAKKCWVNFFIFNFFIFHHLAVVSVKKSENKQQKKTQTHFHSANVEFLNYFISNRIECEEENSVKEKTLQAKIVKIFFIF